MERPILKKLDSNKEIGSSENIKIMIENFNDILTYSEQLEATIECYDNQSGKK